MGFFFLHFSWSGVKYIIATTSVTVSSKGKTAVAGGKWPCCTFYKKSETKNEINILLWATSVTLKGLIMLATGGRRG